MSSDTIRQVGPNRIGGSYEILAVAEAAYAYHAASALFGMTVITL